MPPKSSKQSVQKEFLKRSNDEDHLTINKGKLNSLNVYEVTEDELEKLEKGGPDSIFLNFAIFSLSVAISFLITLITTKIESMYIFVIFLVVMLVGFLSGVILLRLWCKNKNSLKNLVQKIKDRISQK